MTLSDTRRLSRLAFGSCMILAPLLFLASDITGRANSSNDAKHVAQIAAHDNAQWLSGFLLMLGVIAFIGALVGLAHLVRTRMPALANVAGPLAVVGALAMQGWATITMVVDPALGRSPDRAAMVRLYHDITHNAGAAPLIVLFLVLMFSVVGLAIGLWKTRSVPRPLSGSLALAMVALAFGGGTGGSGWLGSLLFLFGMGGIGVDVLRRSDDQWETGTVAPRPPKRGASGQARQQPKPRKQRKRRKPAAA